MASEWVGVVGAAIGGGVTVLSLIVKGRQDAAAEQRRNEREDKQRREDQALAVRQQGHDKRQQLYGQMLSDAGQAHLSAVIASLTALGSVERVVIRRRSALKATAKV